MNRLFQKRNDSTFLRYVSYAWGRQKTTREKRNTGSFLLTFVLAIYSYQPFFNDLT